MDGSGRVTLRNRKFLRKISPVCRDFRFPKPHLNDDQSHATTGNPTDEIAQFRPLLPNYAENVLDSRPMNTDNEFLDSSSTPDVEIEDHVTLAHDHDTNTNRTEDIRRSSRHWIPRQLFQVQNRGKTHLYAPL